MNTQRNLEKVFTTISCVLLLAFSIGVQNASAQKLDMKKLEGMKARSIGPAGMSGRVTAIDVVLDDTDIIYLGTASGGLWKSTSGGVDWKPIFDDQPVASIGALAIDQNNPDVVWVGTGEGNPRNTQNSGDGVFKSMDAGKTWKFMGLKNSRNIHRMIIDPRNPNVVFAGVQGSAWGDHEERGVYKTTDGGKTWNKILYNGPGTGVAEMVMDPTNPNKIFVAMWEFRRLPWFMTSGGPTSGLYVTHDGGETWVQRTSEDGIPKGDLGRMGLAISRANPNRVWALIESKKNALYRSDDGGATFSKISEDRGIGNRPFYYFEIHADTKNENRLYSLHSGVTVSEDGGKTFASLFNRQTSVHPDHHAFWIHPDDPNFIIDGNDGGAAISRDRGVTWHFVENLPVGQFYHVNVDNDFPYNIMGGMQDNGSWHGPAYAFKSGGIRNGYFQEIFFGDGFDVLPDASDSRYVYAMSQGGNVGRVDLKTGHSKFVKPVHADGEQLRFNWNAAIAHDPFDDKTIYYGSQFVHKSTNRGDTWEVISPDLTTDDPEKQKQLVSGGLTYDVTNAENFTTILAIEPSTVEQGVMWVGTDDGNIQITRDGGESWTNVIKNIKKGPPEGTWVPQIRASTRNGGEAFVVFDDHRRNNWETYVYHTKDYGKSWKSLANDEDVAGFALAIAQDPEEENLLFLGTEFGLYVSIDFGENWTKWTNGYPTVSTMDLVIHPTEHDLAIATFGRSLYVLDDIRPLRELARDGADLLDKPLYTFTAPDAYHAINQQAAGTRFYGNAIFRGENRRRGAMITFAFNPPKKAEMTNGANMTNGRNGSDDTPAGRPRGRGPQGNRVKFEVLNADGEVIRTFTREAKPGLNRMSWGLERKGVRMPNPFRRFRRGGQERRNEEPGGPGVLPGTYTVRLSHGENTSETTVNVKMDPRVEVSLAALKARDALYDKYAPKMAVLGKAMERMTKAGETVKLVNGRLADRKDDDAKALKKQAKEIGDKLKELNAVLNGKPAPQGFSRDPNTVMSKVFTARRYLQNGFDMPGKTEEIVAKQAMEAMEGALEQINAFFADDWAAYTKAVDAANISLFETYEPLKIN